ncbi:MAG: hypothetical protein DRI48_06490 [Chloroflexi bacterium]|nr:MAG: hypothetical protein DRI48_06490 [Chloroflexota bacterium]
MEETLENGEMMEEHETDTGAHQESAENAQAEESDSGQNPEGDSALLEMVRAEVEKRVAELIPARRESPRQEAARSHLSAGDYLRLGYGVRSPHT